MIAFNLLRMTIDQVSSQWPELIVHNDSAEIQDAETQAYAMHPEGDFEVVFNTAGNVDTVFLYRDSALLNEIISFSASRPEVLSRFGKPTVSGKEHVCKYLGEQGAWDRYDYPAWSLHFQYVFGGDRVKLVTFMASEVVSRLGSATG